MRIVQANTILGLSVGGPRLVLSQQERAVLKRAAAIFSSADDAILAAGVDQDDYDTRGILLNGWDSAKTLSESGEIHLPD